VEDPIAFFLTIATYGTWLPGDARGWVEYRHGWQLPDPVRELESRARMSEDACLLTASERMIVERQVAETCQHRGWTLHAVNCRSNHLHAVIGAPGVPPKKIRADIKAWSTRRLKEQSACNQAKPEASARAPRENWWAERGSIRWIFDDEALETVVLYATAAQDRKHLDQ
jgi:REP element-mobilizing transposase RayT